ncbi:MAG: hypothetical protein A2504_11635 [Bdellovibrionales bacterium RIFOXYD12_FULL_39_22]|nr:MAG: hypothetical protein A2385_16150 [Bdellovibrionales bacterium RIFOXYB1_FULL_39_21]OFZ44510.1 MAG: hypothetical protein A2485_06745 [Bdellovibrionales bacterium RIFOXYC12_FULL_39_17]OFZ49848.1 MAG: hypothetical protein A2404_00720 [Bdellovibrionales bacterium RIFOXYC1_FULL_39_130]OFZ73009.1 MAG: hypothetical protein A2451_15965 [Bdellovibrionales bacterium RIFOXYC2_FULL_39_8]OFZ76853.1 MAG: hypothetical protein A2560_05520 [Bdellovibrionales bacterium RIFOXYD1_FULL_39_84]OFZ95780.1 MAG:
MDDKKIIFFVGGGSGGHVMPAVALIESLKKDSRYNIKYVGSATGIERKIVTDLAIDYHIISVGKLRRYLSMQNILDGFKIIFGFFQSLKILFPYSRQNCLVFSTGGFVSVPFVLAAYVTRKKIFIHEQTSRVGLANKIASYFADKIFITFAKSQDFFPSQKTFHLGMPLRDAYFLPTNFKFTLKGQSFSDMKRPMLFVSGGGNGSKLINDMIKNNLDWMCRDYLVVHQVGGQFISEFLKIDLANYIAVDFLKDEMIEFLKMASVIISRAGAVTVYQIMTLKKCAVFIPLKIAQKNEQFHNAKEAQKVTGSVILEEGQVESCDLKKIVAEVRQKNEASMAHGFTLNVRDNPKHALVAEIHSAF